MLKKVSYQAKQRGIGLLELMLSLSIIAILLVMATRYFVIANENQKLNNALSMVNGFAGGAANYATATHSYTGMTIENLINGNYIPNTFGGNATPPDGTGANPWGGNLTLSAVQASNFSIQFTGVPIQNNQSPTTCQKLLNLINSASKGLATGCAAGTGTGTVTVTFN
jgi:type II secretory pathway pseudopilin PulG